MTTLHVAALPFPTVQGTQAAVGAIVGALADRDVALMTYAHGDPALPPPRVPHVRVRAPGDRSLRAGPSLPKLLGDVGIARAIARRKPDLVVAHHVEACAASLAARAPTVLVAHTALGPELPTYFARGHRALSRLGDALDAWLARHALATVAVSPRLASSLSALAGIDVRWLPIPWAVPPPIERDERLAARRSLGLGDDERLVLYAGNLDRYQGLGELFAAIRALPGTRLVVATTSDDPLPADLPIVRVLLGDEGVRRRVHAAADVAAIPRASEGGLPIKMIDAMARGVPVAAVETARAGLELDGAAAIGELAPALASLLADPDRRTALAAAGRAWVARELSRERFRAAYDRALSTAAAARLKKRAR